jgi:hypothetical protein
MHVLPVIIVLLARLPQLHAMLVLLPREVKPLVEPVILEHTVAQDQVAVLIVWRVTHV